VGVGLAMTGAVSPMVAGCQSMVKKLTVLSAEGDPKAIKVAERIYEHIMEV